MRIHVHVHLRCSGVTSEPESKTQTSVVSKIGIEGKNVLVIKILIENTSTLILTCQLAATKTLIREKKNPHHLFLVVNGKAATYRS